MHMFDEQAMTGKGYLDTSKFAPRKSMNKPDRMGPNVDFVNNLPTICSKYKKSDRGFSLDKMTKRDYKHIIFETNGDMYSAEQQGYKPKVHGVPFSHLQPRVSQFGVEQAVSPNIYSYTDNMKVALEKYGKMTPAAMKKGQTM